MLPPLVERLVWGMTQGDADVKVAAITALSSAAAATEALFAPFAGAVLPPFAAFLQLTEARPAFCQSMIDLHVYCMLHAHLLALCKPCPGARPSRLCCCRRGRSELEGPHGMRQKKLPANCQPGPYQLGSAMCSVALML